MVVRVVVVDQQPLFRRGLEESMPAVTDGVVRVVAGTDLAENAAVLVRRHEPDVVLLDLELAPPGAAAALSAMRRVRPRLPVLALTGSRGRHATVVDALAAGANGVLLKTLTPAGLVPSLLAAAGAVAQPAAAAPPLTSTERHLWTLIAGGASTVQIARALHVSDRTVKRLTARLLRTLGVASRTEAAALAGRTGLLDDPLPAPGAPYPSR